MGATELSDDLRETVHTLRTLIAITDAGTFAGAASLLRITPSAVSKTVARAEERLGLQLVQRTTRHVKLTELAERYLARGRELASELSALETELVDHTEHVRGRVRIAAPTVYGALFVAPAVAAFQSAHPELQVSLRCDDRMTDLVADGVDLAVRFLSQPPADVIAKVLHDDERGLYASVAYLARRGTPTTTRQLEEHALLHYGAAEGPIDWILEPGARRIQKAPAFSSDSVLAVREAALAGAGIAELPVYLAAAGVAEGRLVALLPDAVPTRRKVYLIYLPSRHLPRRVRACMDGIVDALGSKRAAALRSRSRNAF